SKPPDTPRAPAGPACARRGVTASLSFVPEPSLMFDDNNEDTMHDPNPFGARQRVVPGRRFKAVESALNELDPAQIIDERFILTQRVPKLPPPIPNIRRMNITVTARLPISPVMPVMVPRT